MTKLTLVPKGQSGKDWADKILNGKDFSTKEKPLGASDEYLAMLENNNIPVIGASRTAEDEYGVDWII